MEDLKKDDQGLIPAEEEERVERPAKDEEIVTEEPIRTAPEEEEEEKRTEESAEEEEEEEKPKKKKKKKSFQERIDELVRQREEARREAEYYKRLLQEQYGFTEKEKTPESKKGADQKPMPEDFDTYEEYVEALTDWKLQQRLTALEEQKKLEEEQRYIMKLATDFEARLPEYRKKYEDFDDVALDPTLPYNDVVRRLVLESDVSGDLAYYLGKNRDLLYRIASGDPVSAAREIGRIEAAIKTASQEKTASSSAPVINPVKTGGRSGAKSPDKMSMEEYKQWRMKQMQEEY